MPDKSKDVHDDDLEEEELDEPAEPVQKAPVVRRNKPVSPAQRKRLAEAPQKVAAAKKQVAPVKKQVAPVKKQTAPLKKRAVSIDDAADDADHDDDHEHDDDHDDEQIVSRFGGQYIDSSLGFVQDYLHEVKAILFDSFNFFNAMPAKGGFLPPTIFLAVTAGIYCLLSALFRGNWLIVFTAFFDVFFTAFVGTTVITLAFKQLGGKGTFEGTYRVIAFSKATLLFGWIPWIHVDKITLFGVLSIAYAVYLNILGMERLQKLPRQLVTTFLAIVALIGFIMKLNIGF
jgi:hypothetical protein